MGNNQPKKYRNFMIGAASAALVATAVAPVASAADFSDVKGNTHEPAIKALVEAGVINGYPDGTFQPNKTLTRSDVVKMMGKWLVSLDYKVPADYKTNPRFKDLTSKSNDELLKYAALVKDHGVFNGYADGTLGAGLDITRENMAIVLVRAYDAIHKTDLVTLVKETEFNKDVTDLAKAKAEARPYIDVLDYFDITNPVAPQFNPKNTTTRGQFASFLYKTSNVEVGEEDTEAPKLVYTGEKTLNVEYGKEFTAPVVTATDNVDEKVEVTSVITNEAGERLTAIDTKVPGTYKVTYSAVDAAGNSAEDVVVTVVVGENPVLEVASVKAANATQVKIAFNKAVDKATATDVTNYAVNGTALTAQTASATLSDDAKTVTLTFAENKNGTSFTFEAAGVLTQDKKLTVERYTTTVTVNDTEAPTVTGLAFATNGDLEISFSEPLKANQPIVRVNGQPVEITQVETGVTKVVVSAAKHGVANGATASVYVAGAQDTAGNEMNIYNGSITKVADTTKPAIASITQIGQGVLRVVFTESLGASASDLQAGELKFLKGAALNTTDSTVSKNTTVDPTGKTYDVTFATEEIYGSTAAESAEVTLLLAADAVKDAAGNGNAQYSQSFTFNTDKTGPAFVSAKVAANKQTLELTFNEAIQSSAANIDESKIIVTDANGVRYNVIGESTIAKAQTGEDQKVLLVDFVVGETQIANGTYTVQLQSGAVKDVLGNLSSAASTTVTVGNAADTTKPVPTLDNASTPNKFVVGFGEEVTSSALNLGNYKLDGKALPEGTVVYFNTTAQDKVTIELPAGSINIGNVEDGTNALLNVANVADKAGNLADAKNLTVKVADNTSATISSVQTIGTDVFVTFSESVTVPEDVNAASIFDIKVNGATIASEKVSKVEAVKGNAKQVKFTLTDAPAASPIVTVKANQTDLKDVNGVVVK